MHALSFALSHEGVVRIHDAVLCLAKFSEVVSFEACADRVGTKLGLCLLEIGLMITITADTDRVEFFTVWLRFILLR